MRFPLAVASGLVLSTTVAANTVSWDIAKNKNNRRVSRRSSPDQVTLQNDESLGGYFVTISIGSPGQNLTLQVDTGSSDIWVPYTGASICKEDNSGDGGTNGCSLGSFDPNKSNTFDDVGQNSFHVSYVDNSFATGDYFTDHFTIGEYTIKQMTMGLGINTDIPFGLVGIGYELDEASTSTVQTVYPNLPIAMQQAGDINSVAYSLWLNDLDASTGKILFGGIDTKKYVGDLTTIKVLEDPQIQNFTSFLVDVSVIEASSSSGSDVLFAGKPITAVLDSGTTLSYLPQDVTELIWSEAGAIYSSSLQMGIIPCSFAGNGGSFSFGFGGNNGPRINVTMDELVVDLSTGEGPKFTSGQYEGQSACEFGIQNTTGDTFLLGDTFLRSAYVVYDLVNNEIGIAPTDFNSTDSNVVAFASSGAPIPSATAAPSQDATVSASVASSTSDLSASKGFQSSSGGSSGSSGSSGSNGGDDDSAASHMVAFSWAGVLVAGFVTMLAL